MRDFEKKKSQNNNNNNQVKRSVRTPRRDAKLLERNDRKVVSTRETESKANHDKLVPDVVVSDTDAGMEPSVVSLGNENDTNVSEEDSVRGSKKDDVVAEQDQQTEDDPSAELNRGYIVANEEGSDSETATDSTSSQGDSLTTNEEKSEGPNRVSDRKNDVDADEVSASASALRSHDYSSSNHKSSQSASEEPTEPQDSGVATNDSPESLKGVEDVSVEEHQGETFSDALSGDEELLSMEPNGSHQARTSSESKASNVVGSCKNGTEVVDNEEFSGRNAMIQKMEEMKTRMEKLEDELTEVAALEISLYTVVPDHGSSVHKVHTPARRLSRLYIHACKHWTQSNRATIARSTVSGLVFVARTCGNDVSRLTFWLSNTVVLREIIAQAFGSSSQSNAARVALLNGGGKTTEGNPSSLKSKARPGNKQVAKKGVTWFNEDWQETRTFTLALEKVESWIFSRIVESVWWQALAPHMQSPVKDMVSSRSVGQALGSASDDQKQGSFSVDLWRDALTDAFHRLCPLRAGGHQCGCLPVLAKLVISQCVARLDVAMFNAILRESAHEIPSDPVSDPILDTRALPIPEGDLSFGSGAQLKNAVGNWSRHLDDLLGMKAVHPTNDHLVENGDDDQHNGHARPKWFHLLNELSDLLMLPKDMLVDRSIRAEVCPSISLSLVKRIMCNFTPDEFCPDHVPGDVLEALNAESVLERRLSGDAACIFPYTAAPVVYSPPSTANVAEKVTEASVGTPRLENNASSIQRKGYTSDEELEDLDSPLAYVVENLDHEELTSFVTVNTRYKLLSKVWSV